MMPGMVEHTIVVRTNHANAPDIVEEGAKVIVDALDLGHLAVYEVTVTTSTTKTWKAPT
jgi:UDP-N-acetyl-D-mannosaminuronate dehydrogenase